MLGQRAGYRCQPSNSPSESLTGRSACQVILTFDVEERHRIEAAAGLAMPPDLKAHYAERMDLSTRWLLDLLDRSGIKATFFIVSEIARHNPSLVRDISAAGHEVASHGWDHRRVHPFTPATFRKDVRRSKGTRLNRRQNYPSSVTLRRRSASCGRPSGRLTCGPRKGWAWMSLGPGPCIPARSD